MLGVLMLHLGSWQTWLCCKGRMTRAAVQRTGMAQSDGSLLKIRRGMAGQS